MVMMGPATMLLRIDKVAGPIMTIHWVFPATLFPATMLPSVCWALLYLTTPTITGRESGNNAERTGVLQSRCPVDKVNPPVSTESNSSPSPGGLDSQTRDGDTAQNMAPLRPRVPLLPHRVDLQQSSSSSTRSSTYICG